MSLPSSKLFRGFCCTQTKTYTAYGSAGQHALSPAHLCKTYTAYGSAGQHALSPAHLCKTYTAYGSAGQHALSPAHRCTLTPLCSPRSSHATCFPVLSGSVPSSSHLGAHPLLCPLESSSPNIFASFRSYCKCYFLYRDTPWPPLSPNQKRALT